MQSPAGMAAPRGNMAVRHSIAPRVLDNSLPMRTLTSTARFSVRVEPQRDPLAAPLDDDAPILATFVWKDTGARVQLAGSFDDWRKHDMTYVPGVAYFVLVVELPPGEYYYRFVVDGRWRIAEGDCNLREDPFGELSHFLDINSRALETTTPNRFSTAALTRVDLPRDSAGAPVRDSGGSDEAGSTASSEVESESDGEDEVVSAASAAAAAGYPQVEPDRLPRQHGDEFINDYGDDAYGELDLQADVYEAMFDVKEEVSAEQSRSLLLPPAALARRRAREAAAAQARRRPTNRLFRSVFGKLFGMDPRRCDEEEEEEAGQPQGYTGIGLASPDMLRQVENAGRPKKSRLRVWFPTERGFPARRGGGRRGEQRGAEQVADNGAAALRFNQAEENASSRQQLGKALFAQGKYDAALAMFSLSVKIREDNGLKNAKSSAVAHTDVASAFIHLGDLRNANKHLDMALEIYGKKTFSGGHSELGDVHCFRAVTAEVRGSLRDAEDSYRRAISLYEKCGATRNNANYSTARDNLRDNLRRQKDGPGEAQLKKQYAQQQQHAREAKSASRDSSPVSTVDDDPAAKENIAARQNAFPVAEYRPTPRNAIKSILRQDAHEKPRVAAPPPQTLSTINSFPDTMESAAYPPGTNSSSRLSNSQLMDPRSLVNAPLHHKSPDSVQLPPTLDEYRQAADVEPVGDGGDAAGSHRNCRRSSRPTTWKALADVARASMPLTPVENSEVGAEEDDDPSIGSYEEMSRGWQRDGRKLLVAGKYTEAIDMYTLAIYTRKRHGLWESKANAETHVEYARALFATKDVLGAARTLRDAIQILEKVNRRSNDLMLGQVWGNLGSALDRLGEHVKDAETSHSTGLVLFARAGIAKDDPKWTKAWRNLCVCVKAQGSGGRSIETAWQHIDEQIRGVHPVTSSASVKI